MSLFVCDVELGEGKGGVRAGCVGVDFGGDVEVFADGIDVASDIGAGYGVGESVVVNGFYCGFEDR